MGTIKYDLYDTPSQKNGQKRYHVRAAKSSTYSFKELKKYLCESSSATEGDVEAVMEGIYNLVITKLQNGESVQLGRLGSVSPSIYAPSVNNPKEMNASKINFKGINFRASAELKRDIAKDIHFERVQANEHSRNQTISEIQNKLREFFKTHDSICTREFRVLMNMTQVTAYRRIKELCSQTYPILKHVGPRNSSVYVLAENAKWNL
jgi:predicted histone-like DNA-binding protein